jgi:hypothetical protein
MRNTGLPQLSMIVKSGFANAREKRQTRTGCVKRPDVTDGRQEERRELASATVIRVAICADMCDAEAVASFAVYI